MSLSKELEARGFVHQFSGESLADIVDGGKRIIYHGIDPTADSAHAGNFVNWMLLRHLAEHGHQIIFLVGGGTGMIGDPKTDAERPTADPEQVANNVQKLRTQAEKLFTGISVSFVNNADWLTTVPLLQFLRDIGKNFTINELVKKEAIASRMNSENGISYTEFAYPLLQAFDYLTLHKEYGCDVQVGGSDQWGNMVAGTDLIRRKTGAVTHVLTVPLIVDKTSGKKFGKSEGNAIWLDSEKTSPYEFYQFWLNTADENVIDYLKLFTLLPLTDISDLAESVEKNPGSREAQKALAIAVTTLVHGEAVTSLVKKASEIIFGGETLNDIDDELQKLVLENAPNCSVNDGSLLVDVLVDSELASSKREARTFIESGAIKLNGEVVKATDHEITVNQFSNGLLPLSRGKKKYCILTIKN